MPMTYKIGWFKLPGHKDLRTKTFRYQWAWEYEYADSVTGEWISCREVFENRDEARAFRRGQGNATCFRNWQLKRRLVQSDWDHYQDSWGWNRNGHYMPMHEKLA